MLERAHKITFADMASVTDFPEHFSKRIAPNTDWTGMGGSDHFVQFYESDEFIVNSVAEFVIHGLTTGEVCVVIATRDHTAAIAQTVAGFGVDLEAARVSGSYLSLDAHETLSQFMVDGMPDNTLFDDVVGALIGKASNKRRVRAFGEMVGILAESGQTKAAVELEALWNRVREKRPFSLFCAYRMNRMSGSSEFMEAVCDGHSRVIPDENYTSLTNSEDRLRAIAFLQQRGRQLEAELAELKGRIAVKDRDSLAA